jgi:hypothetical protein
MEESDLDISLLCSVMVSVFVTGHKLRRFELGRGDGF